MRSRGLAIGKSKNQGKRFKSVGENELSNSDKNFIKNNLEKFTIQQIGIRLGVTSDVIERFLKKNKLTANSIETIVALKKENEVEQILTSTIEAVTEKAIEVVDTLVEINVADNTPILAKEKKVVAKKNSKKEVLKPINKLKNKYFSVQIDERTDFIENNFQKFTLDKIADKFKVSIATVRNDFKKLGLKPLKKLAFDNPEIIEFLRNNYRTKTATELSNELGNVSWNSVRYLCEKYGLIRTPEETDAIRLRWRKHTFTDVEQAFIQQNHGLISLKEIANHLGKPRSAIATYVQDKNLKISKEQHTLLNRRNFEKARLVNPKLQPKVKSESKIEPLKKEKKQEVQSEKTPKIKSEISENPIKIQQNEVVLKNVTVPQNKLIETINDDFWSFDFDKKKKKKK